MSVFFFFSFFDFFFVFSELAVKKTLFHQMLLPACCILRILCVASVVVRACAAKLGRYPSCAPSVTILYHSRAPFWHPPYSSALIFDASHEWYGIHTSKLVSRREAVSCMLSVFLLKYFRPSIRACALTDSNSLRAERAGTYPDG